MGKQINFYMDREDERLFLEYVRKIDGKFISFNNFNLYFDIDPEKFSVPKLGNFYCFIYLNLNDIHIHTNVNNKDEIYEFISENDSEVIQFYNSVIDINNKRISRGRIYINPTYFYKNEKIKKSSEINSCYNKLVKWIKHNIPYKEFKYKGVIKKEYISLSLLELIEKGIIDTIN